MREIPAAHRCGRQHREALGELDAGIALDVEQPPQRGLLGVIGAGRVAGRGTDAAVGLVDEFPARQLLLRRVPPMSLPHLLMEILGTRLGEAVCQRLEQDGVVVVVGALERCRAPVHAEARGHGKRADVVTNAGIARRDEIGQAQMRLAVRLAALLAQLVQDGERLPPRLVGVHRDVVVAERCWPGTGRSPPGP